MKARLFVGADGSLALFVDEGTEEEAKAAAAKFVATMETVTEVKIVFSEPEQHRHGPDYAHQHVHGTATHTH